MFLYVLNNLRYVLSFIFCFCNAKNSTLLLTWTCMIIIGPTFVNISHREPEYHSTNDGTEKSSGSGKESSIGEANLGFSFAAIAGQVLRPQCWCSCSGRVCADTDRHTRRLQDTNWILCSCWLTVTLKSPFGNWFYIYHFGWLLIWLAPVKQ